MATYTYEQIKNAARQARADLFQRGQSIEKTRRSKPREEDFLLKEAFKLYSIFIHIDIVKHDI